jgi:hypothetical protein
MAGGWVVLSIDLHKLLLERVRAQPNDWASRVIEMEKRMASIEPSRGLRYVKDKLTPLIEGPQGIAADCSRIITAHAERHPETVGPDAGPHWPGRCPLPVLPVVRSLRHLDGRTRNVPVVLLYPGKRIGPTGLSFMGRLNPDNDYRPRIYP